LSYLVGLFARLCLSVYLSVGLLGKLRINFREMFRRRETRDRKQLDPDPNPRIHFHFSEQCEHLVELADMLWGMCGTGESHYSKSGKTA